MWTYLLHILHQFIKEKGVRPEGGKTFIYIPKITDYIMDELWRRNGGKTLYDEEEDIYEDLKIAEGAGFLNLSERHIIITEQQLKAINEFVENLKNNPLRSSSPLLDEYLKRIEALIT